MIIIDATRILFVYFWVSLTVTAMTVARFMLLYYLLNSIRRPSLSKKLTCQNVRCAFHWIQIFWCFCHHERQQRSIYSQQSVDQWDVLFDLQHVCHLKELPELLQYSVTQRDDEKKNTEWNFKMLKKIYGRQIKYFLIQQFSMVFSVAHFSKESVCWWYFCACVLHITSTLQIMIYFIEENERHPKRDERKSSMHTLPAMGGWRSTDDLWLENYFSWSHNLEIHSHTLTRLRLYTWTRIYTTKSTESTEWRKEKNSFP